MLKKNAQLFEGLFVASDLFVVSLAWALSYWVRFLSGWVEVDKGVPPFIDYLRMLFFVWLIWAFIFKKAGLYKPMRGSRRIKELLQIIRANSLAVLVILSFTYLFREKDVPFSRAVFVIFFFMSTTFVVLSRTLVRSFLREMRRRGYNLRYSLIVGNGDLAKQVARRILAHPEYGVQLMGCLAREDEVEASGSKPLPLSRDGQNGRQYPRSAHLRQLAHGEGYVGKMRVVGSYSDLSAYLDRGDIDQVVVALPLDDNNRLDGILSSVADAMVDVRVVPDFHRFIQLGSQVEEFDGLPVVSIVSTPLSGFNRLLKRSLDLLFGALIFLLALPLLGLIALLIALTSKGPIVFSQERVGLDGSRFKIYKFRTMHVDAEKQGATFAVKNDPRTTWLGKILRQLSLDELPQLWNVIRGDMSLVGPRPERPVFIQQFRQHIPKYMLRHKVQAGMTGWAQVHGWRGNTSIEKRIEYDLYYIENWSLGLDLKILGLTVLNSFRDKNAY